MKTPLAYSFLENWTKTMYRPSFVTAQATVLNIFYVFEQIEQSNTANRSKSQQSLVKYN